MKEHASIAQHTTSGKGCRELRAQENLIESTGICMNRPWGLGCKERLQGPELWMPTESTNPSAMPYQWQISLFDRGRSVEPQW